MTPATLKCLDDQLEPWVRGNIGPQSSIWCAPNSETNVVVTMTESIPGSVVPDILVACYTAIMNLVVAFGDGLVPAGEFNWFLDDLAIHIWNAKSHQMTWSVLGAAIHALEDFMLHRRYWGRATFEICDGQNQVAEGVLGRLASLSYLKGRRVDDTWTICFRSYIQQCLIPCPLLAPKLWECFLIFRSFSHHWNGIR